MPPVINQDVTRIMRGFPVRVYANVTFAADGTVLNLQADGSLLDADHPNAVEFGFTQDGAELSVPREREGLKVDQRRTEILPAITSAVAHMKFGYLEVLDFERTQLLVPGTVFVDTAAVTGLADSNDRTIPIISVVAIAPSAHNPARHQVLVIYACSNIADFLLKLEDAWHKMPVDFQAEDAGRADGRTWFAYITDAPAPPAP